MNKLFDGPEQPGLYESVDLDLTTHDVDSVMQTYLDFLSLPYEERIKLSYFDSERPRIGRSGYDHKTKQKNGGDNKHVFVMSQPLAQAMAGQENSLARESRALLDSSQEIYQIIAVGMCQKYLDMEADFPNLAGIHFPKQGLWQHKLRLLAYEQANQGLLASGHYDKGTGTVAVAESDGGLRLGYSPEDLVPIKRDGLDPIFFKGFGWHQLGEMLGFVPNGKAAWHDVEETGQRVSEEILRWALIFFLDPAHIYLESTQEQTHTPIPWQGLGDLALRSDEQSFLVG